MFAKLFIVYGDSQIPAQKTLYSTFLILGWLVQSCDSKRRLGTIWYLTKIDPEKKIGPPQLPQLPKR